MKAKPLTHATKDLFSTTRCGLNAHPTTKFDSTTPTCPTCKRAILRERLAFLESLYTNGHPDAALSTRIATLTAEYNALSPR